MYLIAEPENISQTDPVDDFCRCATIYLFREDVIQPFRVIQEERLHMPALIQPCDDLCYIHVGLHLEVSECSIRIIKTTGILLLQPAHHV